MASDAYLRIGGCDVGFKTQEIQGRNARWMRSMRWEALAVKFVDLGERSLGAFAVFDFKFLDLFLFNVGLSFARFALQYVPCTDRNPVEGRSPAT